MMQTAPAARRFVKALRAIEKRMEKSLPKNKKMNYSSTNEHEYYGPLNTRNKQKASQTSARLLKHLYLL